MVQNPNLVLDLALVPILIMLVQIGRCLMASSLGCVQDTSIWILGDAFFERRCYSLIQYTTMPAKLVVVHDDGGKSGWTY